MFETWATDLYSFEAEPRSKVKQHLLVTKREFSDILAKGPFYRDL